jgi:hypothetical protein
MKDSMFALSQSVFSSAGSIFPALALSIVNGNSGAAQEATHSQ